MMMENNIKIAITAEFLCHSHFTGIENYLFHLVHSIAELNRINLTLICPPEIDRTLIPVNAEVYKHRSFSFFGTKFVSSLINPPRNLNEFSIVHCPTVVAPFFFKAGKNSNTKIIMTVHDIIPLIYPKYNILRRQIYFKYFLKYRLRFVDYFIVPSKAVKYDIENYFEIDPSRISVIHEGVTDNYKPSNFKKQNYILAVSTLEPRKNFKRIIDCYIKLKKENRIRDKLIIVGKTGWHFKEIIDIPEKLSDSIIFKGYIPEEQLIELYQQAKFFIYPSLYEGFGLPIVEAMASGCPIITSNVSSIPEVAGDAAFYINPKSNRQLIDGILKLSGDGNLRQKLALKGLKQAKKFSWKQCAEKTILLYEKIINGLM
jgi:glycosyltransferase involved in cell wall biosynthesis